MYVRFISVLIKVRLRLKTLRWLCYRVILRTRTGILWFLGQCCCSVAKSCLTLCDPVDCSMPRSSVFYCLREFAQIRVHFDTIQPLILLWPPSPLFPEEKIRVFSNESALHIRWPKDHWSFSISPSSEYLGWSPLGWTGLISLQGKGLSRVFPSTTVRKHQFFGAQLSSYISS